MLRTLLSIFHTYLNPLQEEDYKQLKLPLIKDFFKALCCCLTIFFIPLTVRYYIKDLYPQTYIGIGLFCSAILFFFLRNKLERYVQLISMIYIGIALGMAIWNSTLLLPRVTTHEAYYLGYTVANISRFLDFRVMKFPIVLTFNMTTLILKFCIIKIKYPDQIILILSLEIFPIILNFLSEKSDRFLFSSICNSKNQLLKFKHLLTEFLPNPMVILASDYSGIHFANNAFNKLFCCGDTSQVKIALDGLQLESANTEDNKALLTLLGYEKDSVNHNQPIRLSSIMELIANKKELIKNLKTLSFQVVEQGIEDRSIISRRLPGESSEGLFRQDKDSRFANSMNKLEENDPLESDVRLVYPQKTSRPSLKQVTQAAENGTEGKDNIEKRRHVFKVKLFPLAWDNEEATAMIFDDVTHERTIMELKIADKNKDLVIAMVSHELRTPLNGMLGLLEIMKTKIVQPDVLSYLDACRSSSHLLLNLVNSILDFSQINNNKLKLIYSRVPIAEFMAEIKSLFHHFCLIKGLYLNIEIDPNVPSTIVTDQTRLSQVIINLLGNAFKFTFKGGITVRLRLQEKSPCKVMFSVEDTGIGIKKEDQEKLFRLFGRLEQQDRSINTHGAGLGLTISNNLAMLLNSSGNKGIQVESKEGKGTTFSFVVQSEEISVTIEEIEETYCDVNEEAFPSIPLAERMASYFDIRNIQDAHSDSPRNLKSDSLPSNKLESKGIMNLPSQDQIGKTPYNISGDSLVMNKLKGTKRLNNFASLADEYESTTTDLPWCLIVDDNPFNLMVAMSIMKEKKYRTITALNGQEAILKVKEHQENGHQLKVILMDCQMPVMDGYEATRVLRKMMKEGEVQECDIVALTANNQDEEHEKLCRDAGMNGTLAKPFKLKELEEMLQKMQRGKEMSLKRSREVV